jgi:hypothetical protein
MPKSDPRFEAVAAKAAARAAGPSWLNVARDTLPAFEDRAVANACKWSGAANVYEIRKEAGRRKSDRLATFQIFHELVPDFPCRLTAGKFTFHFDRIATEFLNDPADTPIWSGYCDARETWPTGPVGLVFSWPRVRKCRHLCVFHDVARDDTLVQEAGIRSKRDMRAGFRLMLPILGKCYYLEPMPAFLYGLGYWAGESEESDDERGPTGTPEDEG